MRTASLLSIVSIIVLLPAGLRGDWTLRGGLLYDSPGDFSSAGEALSSAGVESGIGYTVAVGYDLLAFRAEAELMKLKTNLGHYEGALGRVKGDYERTAIFGNAFVDFPLFPLVGGYVGAGVGMARVNVAFDGELAGESTETLRFSDDATIFGAQAMIGLQVELADTVHAQAGYRYVLFSESVVRSSDLSLSSDGGDHIFELTVGLEF